MEYKFLYSWVNQHKVNYCVSFLKISEEELVLVCMFIDVIRIKQKKLFDYGKTWFILNKCPTSSISSHEKEYWNRWESC